MAVDVVMPQMGESIFEGTITKWLKKPGDRIERDEPLFEISTDKVDAEIPSPAAGVLREIKVAEGATVPIQTVVAVIDAAGAAASAPERTIAASPASAAAQSTAAPAWLLLRPAVIPGASLAPARREGGAYTALRWCGVWRAIITLTWRQCAAPALRAASARRTYLPRSRKAARARPRHLKQGPPPRLRPRRTERLRTPCHGSASTSAATKCSR